MVRLSRFSNWMKQTKNRRKRERWQMLWTFLWRIGAVNWKDSSIRFIYIRQKWRPNERNRRILRFHELWSKCWFGVLLGFVHRVYTVRLIFPKSCFRCENWPIFYCIYSNMGICQSIYLQRWIQNPFRRYSGKEWMGSMLFESFAIQSRIPSGND